jgi:hypothetical protein
MGILLLFIVVVIAMVLGYVAASFDVPVTRKVGPLLGRAVQKILDRTEATADETGQRIEDTGASLLRHIDRAATELKKAAADLDTRVSGANSSVAAELAFLKRAIQQISAVQAETSRSQLEIARDVRELQGTAGELVRHSGEVSALITEGATQCAGDLDSVRAQLRQIIEEQGRVHSQLAGIGQVLARHVEEAAARSDGQDRAAAERMLVMARDMQALLDGQAGAMNFVRAVLEDGSRSAVADGHVRQIISVRLPCDGRDDYILRELTEALCDQLRLTKLLPLEPGASEVGAYYAWRSPCGEPLADALTTLLASCRSASTPARAGLDELRSLLIALHAVRPATVRFGPLILVSTVEGLFAVILNAEEADHFRPAASPEDTVDRLRNLGLERAVELSEWADGYFAQM